MFAADVKVPALTMASKINLNANHWVLVCIDLPYKKKKMHFEELKMKTNLSGS